MQGILGFKDCFTFKYTISVMKFITKLNAKYRISVFLLVISMFTPFLSFSQPKPIECKASFYADFFHGRKTANGEIYNQKQLTAAHRSLPFGTILKVTNTENQQSVVVRVNDRGPYVKGRGIDLSKAAASQIGIIRKGVGNVVIEPLNNDAAYMEYVSGYSQNEEGALYTYEDDLNGGKSYESAYPVTTSLTSQIEDTPSQPLMQTPPDYYESSIQNMKYTPDGLFTIGNAVVYPDASEGKVMKNGEKYNGGTYVCAHNKYPVGSYLKITRKSDPNLSVVVQVAENQPGIMDYDIQLSWIAASDLELIDAYDRSVIVEEIMVTHLDALPELEHSSASKTTNPERSIEIDFFDGSASLRGEGALSVESAANQSMTKRGEALPVNNLDQEEVLKTGGLGLFRLEASRVPENGYGIQIAVVSQYREVLEISDKLFQNGIQNTLIHSDLVGNEEVLRYIVGPFDSKEEAEQLKSKLEGENIYGMIIRLEPLR